MNVVFGNIRQDLKESFNGDRKSKNGLPTHALLEADDLLVRQGVGLGDNGDEIDFGVQALHEFDVNLLETGGQGDAQRWRAGWNAGGRTCGRWAG